MELFRLWLEKQIRPEHAGLCGPRQGLDSESYKPAEAPALWVCVCTLKHMGHDPICILAKALGLQFGIRKGGCQQQVDVSQSEETWGTEDSSVAFAH